VTGTGTCRAGELSGKTSKTYPWSFWYVPLWPRALHAVPARVSVSSQVSQVP
jgi:hypothetical protein